MRMEGTSKYKLITVNGKSIGEHRHVMEQYLGRKLCFNEVVHHINEIKSDNRIENLQVMTRAEHSRLTTTNYYKSDERKSKMFLSNKLNNKSHRQIRSITSCSRRELDILLTAELKYLGLKEGDKIYCCVEEKDGKKRIIVEGVK